MLIKTRTEAENKWTVNEFLGPCYTAGSCARSVKMHFCHEPMYMTNWHHYFYQQGSTQLCHLYIYISELV